MLMKVKSTLQMEGAPQLNHKTGGRPKIQGEERRPKGKL